MSEVRVAITRLPHGDGLPLPEARSAEAAGLDIFAAVSRAEPAVLQPGGIALVPTGFAMALPRGYEAQVRPRSGLAVRHGVTILNAPGTIDADYRGEVKVLLVNHGREPFIVEWGMRIAQMVIAPVVSPTLVEVGELPASSRGTGGFGSTGLSG